MLLPFYAVVPAFVVHILSDSLSEQIFYVAQAMQMQQQSAAPTESENTSLVCMDKGGMIRTMLSVPLPVDKKTPVRIKAAAETVQLGSRRREGNGFKSGRVRVLLAVKSDFQRKNSPLQRKSGGLFFQNIKSKHQGKLHRCTAAEIASTVVHLL